MFYRRRLKSFKYSVEVFLAAVVGKLFSYKTTLREKMKTSMYRMNVCSEKLFRTQKKAHVEQPESVKVGRCMI